jgi:Flp pilus assembly pilin Flp
MTKQIVPAKSVAAQFRKNLRKQRGANMVEYMVLVAVVALAGIAAFNKFSTSIDQTAEKQGANVAKLGASGK